MRFKNRSTGFTLLEIIVVIIVIGVLASLAIPRYFSMIEFSRSTEALAGLGTVRNSLERCYMASSQTYVGCDNFTSLDVDDPANTPSSHFTYAITVNGAVGFTITATRNTLDGGDTAGAISLDQDNTIGKVTRSGTTVYMGVK